MKEISRQLLYQRLRNRVIELFEILSAIEDIARLGAFETINTVYDLLPLDYGEAPKVFSVQEKEAIAEFIELVESASDVTNEDVWDVEWFESSQEWARLAAFAKTAVTMFYVRGWFSEDKEDPRFDQ